MAVLSIIDKLSSYPTTDPDQTTNTVVHIQINDYNTGQQIIDDYANSTLSVYTNPLGPDALLSPSSSFTFKYGVDINTNPWTADINATLTPAQDIQSYSTYYNTNGNLIMYTPYGLMTYVANNPTNDVGEETLDANNTNGYQSETDSVGNVMSYLPPTTSLSTNTVIIQRTTNFMSWENIYTDYVSPGGISYFTDTQIFLPTFTTFYNTATNSGGGGMIPPGVTNVSGTNGVIDIPAGAYYRLAYPPQ